LKNIPTTADALPALQADDVKALFESTGVLSPVELASRYEVYAEQYILSIEVEAKLVVDMATTIIYPAAARYLSELSMANSGMAEMGVEMDHSIAQTVATEASAMMVAVNQLSDALTKEEFGSTDEHTQYFANEIRGLMDEVRLHADTLETVVADELWPLAKYHEMLFIK
jgi:glutamine synthetase